MNFSGVYTALITPFKNEQVDVKALQNICEAQIKAGIAGLVPCGTTGETPTLSEAEKETVLSAVLEVAKGKVPVIAGVGTNSTSSTIVNAEKALALGADCLLIMSPYYNKPTQEGIFQHFKAVHDKVSLPIMVYNIKGRTGVNIETPTMEKIAGLERVNAVKEASGDISQIEDVCLKLKDQISVLSGDDALTLPLLSLGGHGVVSVVSNIVPEMLVAMVAAYQKGDLPAAIKAHDKLLPVSKAMFLESNPIPVKTAAAVMGLCEAGFRLPMTSMSKKKKAELMAVLRRQGVLS
jgi:4-hydroxy-tetrahydrodipicolinate synthase